MRFAIYHKMFPNIKKTDVMHLYSREHTEDIQ